MTNNKEWFDAWFDSPYYHILYKNHDDQEAKYFIDSFLSYFQFPPSLKVMDLACGRGRHSAYLNSLGYDVVGIDLSKHNIAYAKQFENDKLKFVRHDMRDPFGKGEFDIVLNVFTSFGYFNTIKENWRAVLMVRDALKKGGTFLLDFFNPNQVSKQLIPYQEKEIDGIHFKIRKEIKGEDLFKYIDFEDNGKEYHFREKVRLIRKEQFIEAFNKLNLELKGIYGDYKFGSFDAEKSQRLIFSVIK